ncbi:hypothetical protein BVG16_15485 [Paenibacillus selenitireducens]|uniref:Uncharacterized protein n=1 Tax=Paenibacillus selenitireducens TaxID=1324314 RepID=A0A1T2XD35_9BACL|nr:hypothetical protein [Paenibacillus selenitireducens]OPA77824.1 hypothetical protein BVG16_15485 [Paenibacillus selenitireducens]
MRKQWKIILFTSILMLITIAVSSTQFSNPYESSHVNDEKFSVERAMQHLEIIAKVPHPVGSEANKKVKDYIVKYLMIPHLKHQAQVTMVMEL